MLSIPGSSSELRACGFSLQNTVCCPQFRTRARADMDNSVMSMRHNILNASSYLARYVLWNAVDITDYRAFPARSIRCQDTGSGPSAPPASPFTSSGSGNDIWPLLMESVRSIDPRPGMETIERFLDTTQTAALLVIRDDVLLLERYGVGYGRSSVCISFSVAKSFVSASTPASATMPALAAMSLPTRVVWCCGSAGESHEAGRRFTRGCLGRSWNGCKGEYVAAKPGAPGRHESE